MANLGLYLKQALRIADDLQKNNWIDNLTRAVFIEFNVYNANTGLFSMVTLLGEMLPSGKGFAPYKFPNSQLTKQYSL